MILFAAAACGGDDHRDGGKNNGGDNPGGAANAKFFLPTGDEARNTVNPTIETDGEGNIHTIYPAYAFGDAFYSFCDADCDDAGDVKVVRLPTEGTVANAMIAIGPDNKPQVLLSTYLRVYYGTCSGDCTTESSWTLSVIREHENDAEREISGEAFALTNDGKPRFVMHAYRAFLGIGQPTPITEYFACDSDCHDGANWSQNKISDQIWQESTLRLDAAGNPRLATVAIVENESGKQEIAGYIACDHDCDDGDNWLAVGLYNAWSDRNIEQIDPAVSLALTSNGEPRMLILGKEADGGKHMVYFACDAGCEDGANWEGTGLIKDNVLGAGLDLALDAEDRPRVVYTAASNIFLAWCKSGDCAKMESPWDLKKVEFGSDMPTDNIFPYWNCTVAAWFLRHPSIAIAKDGTPRVAYRAEDISGGTSNPDPTKPRCEAGVDLTWARFARMPAL